MMKNGPLMISLTLAIVAGAATQSVAASDNARMPHDGPRHSFQELDANGDGKLTRTEMSEHMQARFAAADANGDGKLTREELLARMEGKQEERRGRMIERIFEKHDANKDGVLTAEEMQQGRADRMFAALDADGDGALSETEFEERWNIRKHGHSQGED